MRQKQGLYSDGIHLISIFGIDHLHAYCQIIGIKRCWFHVGRILHYDIPKKKRLDFFKNHPEVIKVSSKDIVKLSKTGTRK